jgi:hypothetical protein
MDPRSNDNSGLGLSQPGSDMGPLPTIRTPQTFHAPDTAAPHFDTAQPQIGAAAPPIQPIAPSVAPAAEPVPGAQAAPAPAIAPATPAVPAPAASSMPQAEVEQIGPVDDDDTEFDEEWVNRAREVVEKTRNDPFIQSHELSKVKAQYIKLRYNKDIKVSE